MGPIDEFSPEDLSAKLRRAGGHKRGGSCVSSTTAAVHVHDRELLRRTRADRDLPAVPLAWLLTVARNELIDSVRRGHVADQTRRRLAMEPLELSDEDLTAVEQAAADADLLADLRAVLPEDQSCALIARVIEERDYTDIADDLKTSPSVVRKRVSRALAQLRSVREETT